jgi:acetyl-CoA acetyltransferase family protein
MRLKENRMSFDRVEIPYGAYWSSPFAKWQGALQHLHSMKFAAHVAKAELKKRNIAPEVFDFGVLGMTLPQFQSFYGAPWPLYEIGLKHVVGPTMTQVCSTGARVVLAGASEIQVGLASVALVLATDRTSNGAHVYYPAPNAPGGTGQTEDPMLYNFSNDAIGGHSMLETAENVAQKYQISTQEQHDVVLRRYEQYQDALANGRAFHKKFMTLPFPVPRPNFKGEDGIMEGDEGIFPTTRDALAKLRPAVEGGTVTFGGQTHPADGTCAMIITSANMVRELSADPNIQIRFAGFGQGRVDMTWMPLAPVAATKNALKNADLKITDMKAVKSHNPFAVNDVAFARETGYDIDKMNNYGCSLIWGHPQGATAMRLIIELIEELVQKGGGYGLFQGCAAGDSSLATIIEVSDRKSAA